MAPRARTAPCPIVFTLGYEGRSVGDFVDALSSAGVERVVDVRQLPLSRRRGFSKTPLSAALADAGIEYVHLREAGNPYRAEKQNIQRCLALYATHIDKHPDVLATIERVIGEKRSALLCVESASCNCHRSVIASRLRQRTPRLTVTDL